MTGPPSVLDGRTTRDRLGRLRLDCEVRDAELRRVLFERALDGATNTAIGGKLRPQSKPRPIVHKAQAVAGFCPGCGAPYGKHHRARCEIAEAA